MKLKSSLKQRLLRAFAGGVLAAALLPASNAFAVATFPSSGSCAMLVTIPVPFGENLPASSPYNVLAVITFTSATAGTIDYYVNRVTYDTGGITEATPETGSSIAVAIAPLNPPAPSAARSITFTPTGGTQIVANAIAVNGGNTILVQGQNQPFSGVCQF